MNQLVLKIKWKEDLTEGSLLTLSMPHNSDCWRIKRHLKDYFSLEVDDMCLFVGNTELEDESLLGDLGTAPSEVLELVLKTSSGHYPSTMIAPYSTTKQESDILSVKGVEGKMLSVEIVHSNFKKPFLGGFVNTKTSVEYHHAEAQTRRKSNIRMDINHEDYVSQILQTEPSSSKYQQAGCEKAVQTLKSPPRQDYPLNKVITPSDHYVTAAEVSELFLKNVIVIQRSVRKWRARKKILRAQKYKKERTLPEEESNAMVPKSREDFQRLYADLEKWRNLKNQELNESHAKDPKALSRERAKLILEEAKRLITIDESKGRIHKDFKKESIVHSIVKAGEPRSWTNGKGQLVKVETQDTLRAKQLSQVYLNLSKTSSSDGDKEERMAALLSLADVIGQLEHCPLTTEIIQLAEREEDLRKRSFKSNQLLGLMTRIENLFLKLIQSPIHNPAISSKMRRAKELANTDLSLTPKELPIEYCKGCLKYLPKTCFGQAKEKGSENEGGKQKLTSRCMRCRRLDNDARTRQDLSIYKDMLNFIKKDEEVLHGFDSPIFKLKDSDIRQIVVNFWGAKSILSGLDDPYDLCLVRWNKNISWSPWNCILLSFEEGAIHSQLSDVKKVYKHFLIERVNYRHTLARIHFAKDPSIKICIQNDKKSSLSSKEKALWIKGTSMNESQEVKILQNS